MHSDHGFMATGELIFYEFAERLNFFFPDRIKFAMGSTEENMNCIKEFQEF